MIICNNIITYPTKELSVSEIEITFKKSVTGKKDYESRRSKKNIHGKYFK